MLKNCQIKKFNKNQEKITKFNKKNRTNPKKITYSKNYNINATEQNLNTNYNICDLLHFYHLLQRLFLQHYKY